MFLRKKISSHLHIKPEITYKNQKQFFLAQGGSGSAPSILPISDIRTSDAINYSQGEKLIRCKLAALYRLVDMHGWSGLHTHISVSILCTIFNIGSSVTLEVLRN